MKLRLESSVVSLRVRGAHTLGQNSAYEAAAGLWIAEVAVSAWAIGLGG